MSVVEYVVAKGKTELGRYAVVVEGSSVAAITETDEPRDVVFTLTPALAESIESGALSVGVGFMRGTVKMTGDFAVLLAVLPVLHGQSGLVLAQRAL